MAVSPAPALGYSQKIGSAARSSQTRAVAALPPDVPEGATWTDDLPSEDTIYPVRPLPHIVTCPCVCCCCSNIVPPPPAGAKQIGRNSFVYQSSLASWKPMYCAKCARHIHLASLARKPIPMKTAGWVGCGCMPFVWIICGVMFSAITQSDGLGWGAATVFSIIVPLMLWNEENKAHEKIEDENIGNRHAARAAMTSQCTDVENAGLLLADPGGLYLGFYNPRIAELYAKLNDTQITF